MAKNGQCYILKLKRGKWYVGYTTKGVERIQDHIDENGAKWTKKYAPVKPIPWSQTPPGKTKATPDNKVDNDEDKLTLKLMKEHGIKNVRGGSWCMVKMRQKTKRELEGLIEGNTNIDDDLQFEVEIDTPPEIELKNQEIDTLRGQIEDLRGEIVFLQDNLSNSENVIDQIEEEAAMPVQEDIPVDVDGSDIVEPEEEEEDIIFPIDGREHVYEITTCGKMGKDPPSNSDCNDKHIQPWFSNPSIYGYDGSKGIHHWYVPRSGSYIIEAGGSSGGTIRDSEEVDVELNPGKGAVVRGIFYLKEGEKYNIIIGQKGTSPTHRRSNPWNGGAGAGGGTFVWKDGDISNRPLIIAGGGGGQGVLGHRISGYGGDGSLSYDSSTGVVTYTGPSAAETRAHFSGGTGVGISNGQVSIGQSVGTTDDVSFGTVTANLTGDVTGTVSSLSNHTTDSLQEASEGDEGSSRICQSERSHG